MLWPFELFDYLSPKSKGLLWKWHIYQTFRLTSVVQLRNTNISNEKLSLPEQNGGLRNFRQFKKRVETTLRKLKCSATSRNISFSRDKLFWNWSDYYAARSTSSITQFIKGSRDKFTHMFCLVPWLARCVSLILFHGSVSANKWFLSD